MADYREFDLNPNSLPDEYVTAIGRIVAASAHTEALVQDAIAGALSDLNSFGLGRDHPYQRTHAREHTQIGRRYTIDQQQRTKPFKRYPV